MAYLFSLLQRSRPRLGLSVGLLCWAMLAWTMPAEAKEANFNKQTLTPGFGAESATTTGHTGGSYSLSALSNRDLLGNSCLGYGDSQPDHVVVLTSLFPQLTVQVDSAGGDTTLVIEGPDGFLCGNDIDELNADALVSGESWQPGTYRIWVGTMTPSDRRNYRLSWNESLIR